ncbi:MAG: type II toxin-antitoxin system HicB family antitoxin [Rectinemataceae bacterium]
MNANVLVSFRGNNIDELEASFHDVVDTYLEDCRQSGEDPQKPFSGKIVVRISPDLHRRVMIKAASRKVSMNQSIGEILERETADLESLWSRAWSDYTDALPSPWMVQKGRLPQAHEAIARHPLDNSRISRCRRGIRRLVAAPEDCFDCRGLPYFGGR